MQISWLCAMFVRFSLVYHISPMLQELAWLVAAGGRETKESCQVLLFWRTWPEDILDLLCGPDDSQRTLKWDISNEIQQSISRTLKLANYAKRNRKNTKKHLEANLAAIFKKKKGGHLVFSFISLSVPRQNCNRKACRRLYEAWNIFTATFWQLRVERRVMI